MEQPHDDYWECAACGDDISMALGYDKPEHSLCWLCSTVEVTRVRGVVRELVMAMKRHLMYPKLEDRQAFLKETLDRLRLTYDGEIKPEE